jgi:hypothetical protein
MVSRTHLGSFDIGQDTKIGDLDGDGQEDTIGDLFSEESDGGAELSDKEKEALSEFVATQLGDIAGDLGGLGDDVEELTNIIEQLGKESNGEFGDLTVDVYEVEGEPDEVATEMKSQDEDNQKMLDDALAEIETERTEVDGSTGDETTVNEKTAKDGTRTVTPTTKINKAELSQQQDEQQQQDNQEV